MQTDSIVKPTWSTRTAIKMRRAALAVQSYLRTIPRILTEELLQRKRLLSYYETYKLSRSISKMERILSDSMKRVERLQADPSCTKKKKVLFAWRWYGVEAETELAALRRAIAQMVRIQELAPLPEDSSEHKSSKR